MDTKTRMTLAQCVFAIAVLGLLGGLVVFVTILAQRESPYATVEWGPYCAKQIADHKPIPYECDIDHDYNPFKY